VCGAARGGAGALGAQRNPFKLIALCVLYALGFWFAALLLIGEAVGEVASAASAQHIPGGTLLLGAIALSIALTVRGKLPGTARPAAAGG
jgi:hypothetical protein